LQESPHTRRFAELSEIFEHVAKGRMSDFLNEIERFTLEQCKLFTEINNYA